MSIRYKFRSSVNFDALEIGERASIPVWELRTKILKGKTSQQQQQGFDLVFSDADSGLEFKGDDCQIASGASVIVKRVPAVTMPSAVSPGQALKNVEIKEYHNPNPGNEQAEEFNDLGADLCLAPVLNIPEFNPEFDDNDFLCDGMDQVAGTRTEFQKQGPSDLSQETPRGRNQFGNERIAIPRFDQQIKQINLPASNTPPCTNLPVEMKCPLCNSFFKEAMMIPCCQHSFCQKCIHRVLIEKSRCPKCFSSKCRVEDLLPNLSLRQAIEHFLEAEMLDVGFEIALQNYVPDGESGIQAREFSCAPSVIQRELEMPQSSSAAGRGSNQVHTEAFLQQQRQRNMQFGASGNKEIRPTLPSQKVNQIDCMSGYPRPNDKPSVPEDFVPSADFQGENQPVIPPANVHFEGDYNTRRNFMGPGGHRKGIRNCYTCGSPDHLMRDCPMSQPNPMFQPGNGAYHGGMPGYAQPPYWNGSPMPPFRPYANMYGNHPGMIPFNTSMVPVAPFTAPPYFPSMGASMSGPGAYVRMGNMEPLRHAEHFGLQPCMNKRKHPNEELERESISEGEDDSPERLRHVTPERSHDQRTLKEDTRSDDSFARRSAGKNQHDKFSHNKVSRPSNSSRDKRSISGKEDASRSSESRHRHHHHGESRRHHERKGHCESESSHGYHSAQKDAKRRPDPDVRGSHRSPPSERREYRDRDTGHRDEYRHHKRRAHRE